MPNLFLMTNFKDSGLSPSKQVGSAQIAFNKLH